MYCIVPAVPLSCHVSRCICQPINRLEQLLMKLKLVSKETLDNGRERLRERQACFVPLTIVTELGMLKDLQKNLPNHPILFF